MRLVRVVVWCSLVSFACGGVPPDGSDAGAQPSAGGRAGGRAGGGSSGGGSAEAGGSAGGFEQGGGVAQAGGVASAGGSAMAGGAAQAGGEASAGGSATAGGTASAGGVAMGGGSAGGLAQGGGTVTGGFSVMVAPSTVNLAQGSTRTLLVTLVRTNFFDPVSIGLATGTPAAISTAPLTIAGASGQLQLTVGPAQPIGALDVFVEATSGSVREVALLHLEVLDGIAPTVLSTTPANQAIGVRNDATVTIRFSEPMDVMSVQQAFSSTMGPSTFAWNVAHTELTVTPVALLAYAPLNGTQSYSFGLANTATDGAGNGLAALSATFSTLRTTLVDVPSVAAVDGYLIDDRFSSGGAQAFTTNPNLLVGDSSINQQITSWVSFDLSLVPVARASDLLEAELVLPLFQTMGIIDTSLCPTSASCLFYSPVNYGSQLGVGAYSTTLAPRTPMIRQQIGVLTQFKHDVLAETVAAWTNRASRSNRLQFELELSNPNNGNARADYYEFTSGDGSQTSCPYVRVTALLP